MRRMDEPGLASLGAEEGNAEAGRRFFGKMGQTLEL